MFMICYRCALGGAEKRYARVFEMLVSSNNAQHRLYVTRSMLDLLNSAGILNDCDGHIEVLDPPSTRYRSIRRFRSLNIVLDSLWYMWRCCVIVARHPGAIFHPLLTAVHYSYPAFMLLPNRRLLLSAYSYQFENYRDRSIFGIRIGATLKRSLMKRASAIDALSWSIRSDLLARAIDPDKIRVAPNSFTDLSRCCPAHPKKKWVVFVGRLEGLKNPLLLAHAIPTVLAAHPDAHFFFIGSGAEEKRLLTFVRDQNLEANVTVQFDPVPTRILAQSSIFVSLQREENYPSQSLLEAMACGNAIVATDSGETWRLVDSTNGVRVDCDAEPIGAAIVRLLDDPQLRQRQEASRQRILTEHTPEKYFDYITGVYAHVNAS